MGFTKMPDEEFGFSDPEDEISKAWIESVIRGRLSDFGVGSIFCLGPPGKNTTTLNGYSVCGNAYTVKTHVKNEFVAFCDDHIIILHNYLKKNPNNRSRD